MSDDGDFAEFVALLQVLQTEFYIQFALTALVVYEYLLTFQDEIRMIWRRKWTGATALFVANRYLLIASIILQALPSTPESVYRNTSHSGRLCATPAGRLRTLFSAARVRDVGPQRVPLHADPSPQSCSVCDEFFRVSGLSASTGRATAQPMHAGRSRSTKYR
ncbi:hypothetical protein PsYK624_123660 [Phanerochaete sordida]|uniref:DUF6533 domain-containing protein n=1 Tax=Phanerochaete sordida TaxID=48140 RepID=A0A9P3GJP0_9APHY|nr:hypothetical protein PsYK624_123660 [Phanerochaete sordida]